MLEYDALFLPNYKHMAVDAISTTEEYHVSLEAVGDGLLFVCSAPWQALPFPDPLSSAELEELNRKEKKNSHGKSIKTHLK